MAIAIGLGFYVLAAVVAVLTILTVVYVWAPIVAQ